MGSSKYIGRVGALAVALGVGCAVAAPATAAWAETTESTDATNRSEATADGTTGSGAAGTTTGDVDDPTASQSGEQGETSAGGDTSDPAEQPEPSSSPTAHTVEVAPGVVISSSGGAHTATPGDGPAPDADELEPDGADDSAGEPSDDDAAAEADNHDGPADTATADTDASPSTAVSAQSTRGDADTSTVQPAEATADTAATESVTLEPATPHLTTRPVATPVSMLHAIVEAVMAPILSGILNALPGDPANSPFGWLLLAAARRQVGVDTAAPSLTMAAAATFTSLVAEALPAALDVLFGTPLPATGAVTGQIVTGDGMSYTVTAPPASGKLVFDSATATFTYTPTTAQRIAAAVTGNATIAMTVTATDGVNTSTNVVNIPVAGYPLSNASGIDGVGDAHAIAVQGTRAYITDKAAGTVTVIDTQTNAVVRTYSVGAAPDGIAVKHDGTRFYVSSSENNTVRIVKATTGTVIRTFSIATPRAIAVSGSGATLFVASHDVGTVRKINLSWLTTSTVKLPAGSRPTGLVVSPDNKRVYVISSSAAGGGSVAIVGSRSSITIADFTADPTALAVSPDSKRLYVTTAGQLSVIDTSTRAVVATHTVDGAPAAVTVTKDGTTLLVSDAAGVVSALDAATGAVLGTIATGVSTDAMAAPGRIAQSADGTMLFLTDAAAGAIRVVALPPTNSVPVVGAPELNPPSSTSGAVTGHIGATDPDGDGLKYTVSAGPKKGKLSLKSNGTFTYTPTAAARHAAAKVGAAPDANDTFTITVTDAKGATVLAPVTVNILPANRTPVVKVSVGTPSSTTGVVTGRVTATDGDRDVRTYTSTTSPTKGTVTVNASTGGFTYTPTAAARHAAAKVGAAAEARTDTFTVTVDDGHGGVVVKTVTVAIRPANAKPSTPTIENLTNNTVTGVVSGTVKSTDADNDLLQYSVTPAKKGTLTMQSDGSFTYEPTEAARRAAAQPGATTATKTDKVTVTVADGYGGTATITLTLDVAPALPPSGGGYQADVPTLAIGTVTGKVTAVQGDSAATYVLGAGPAKGLVKVDAATGSFVYVPNLDARYAAAATPGTDTDMFSVTVTDSTGQVTSVAVTVEVAPPLTSAMDQRSTSIAVTAQEMYFFSQADTTMALELLKNAGVTNIRVLVPWMGVEFLNDWWSFDGVDRMINGAAARDIEVLAVLNSPPMWVSLPDALPLTSRPTSAAEFAEYAGKVAARYKGKISAYEIWNEPNYIGFWAPGPNAAQYAEILKAAYPVIKAADPNAVVLAGSVASVIDFLNITANPVRFIKEMYAAGAAGYFDAIAFHPYLYGLQFSKGRTTVNAPYWQANEIYKLMVANGDGNKKIWATEYGQPSHLVSEASQAAYITDFLRTWRTLSYAGPAFIQTIKDNTEADENAANMGLFRKDWTPKQAWFDLLAIIEENRKLVLGL